MITNLSMPSLPTLPWHCVRLVGAAVLATSTLVGCALNSNEPESSPSSPGLYIPQDAIDEENRQKAIPKPPDSQLAIDNYTQYYLNRFALHTQPVDQRHSTMEQVATGQALQDALTAAKQRTDSQESTQERTVGKPYVFPQIATWDDNSITLLSCVDGTQITTYSSDQPDSVGTPGGKYLMLATLTRENNTWKVNTERHEDNGCITYSDPYSFIDPKRLSTSQTPTEDQNNALEIYKQYWNTWYNLTDHPQEQWTNLMGEYSSDYPQEIAVASAREVAKKGRRYEGGPQSNPILITAGHIGEYQSLRLYDCQDQSGIKVLEQDGSFGSQKTKGMAWRTTMKKINSKWMVTDLTRFEKGSCA